jgi:hypothetical protein
VDQGELDALSAKLSELLALRALGDADPPADRLRALAARFPGALRELDRTPVAVLTERLEALRAARISGEAPDWARSTSRYHGWLRVGLRMRAASARTEAAAILWASTYVPVFPGDPTRERLRPEVLGRLVAPPSGRLVRVAVLLAAEDSAVTPEALEASLVGR